MKRIFLSFFLFIFVALMILKFIYIPILNKIVLYFIAKHLDRYNTDLVRGPFYLTEQYFKEIPESRIDDKMDELAKQFGFPISVEKISALDISGNERNTLINGAIVIREKWTIYHKRLNQTDMAITFGPIKNIEDIISMADIERLEWATFILLMAIFSLIWTIPFWKNLKTIMVSSEQFGKGRLDIRADVMKRSPLRPLADTFNAMAERISALVNSQKMLINAVSHEFRTPVSRIRFGLEMLELSESREDKQRHLRGIYGDIGEIESLVSELIAYVRFDRIKPELSIEVLPTYTWLKSLADTAGRGVSDIGINISETGLPETLNADPKYMGRAVENLLSNALRHAKSVINISARIENGFFVICVEDDGPGIAEADRERIFEPFVRLDESRNRDSGGYGLGLAIVRQIMGWHEGIAAVSASSSGGACFCLKWL